jgi:hypothetical protein
MTTTEYKTRLAELDNWNSMEEMRKDLAAKLRPDLTPEERERALRIGRVEFKSAGATRQR